MAPVLPSALSIEPEFGVSARAERMAAEKTTKPAQLVSLQYLRALAAMLVVYFHSVIQMGHVYSRASPPLAQFGASGVDIFFILSGLVMWISTANRDTHPRDFLKRRLVRIVPLYWAATLVAALVAITQPDLLHSTVFTVEHTLASLFFIPYANPAAVRNGLSETLTPLVVPGWTLNYEMLFYLLFATALLARRSLRVPVIVALVVLTYLVSVQFSARGSVPAFYGSTIMFEFLGGVAIGALGTGWLRLGRSLAIILLIGSVAALLGADYAHAVWPRFLVLGLPAFAIVALTLQIERSCGVPFIGWLHDMGDASYSIYLTHIFVLAGLRIAVSHFPTEDSLAWQLAFAGGCIVTSFLVGTIVHRLYERPVTVWVRRIIGA